MSDDDSLTLQEAADALAVHYMTAYRYVRLGRLPAEKTADGWTVRRRDLAQVQEHAPKPGRAPQRGRTPARHWADRLEARLLEGDEPGAWGVVEAALVAGASPQAAYLDVLAPALRAIGERWEREDIDVADEHRASAVAVRIVGRLGPRFTRRGRRRGTVVLGTPPGELHSIPGAIVADVLRGAGYALVDLGCNVPVASLCHAASTSAGVTAIAVSATATDAQTIRSTIEALHACAPGVPILVGGGAVVSLAAARALGADEWAPDAAAAVEVVERLRNA